MRRLTALLAATAVALGAAACGDDPPNISPITPSVPATVTDTFTGTLNRNGGATYTFIAARTGNITATLVSLGPDSGLTVGLSIGAWNGNSCSAQIAKDNAVQTSYVLGTASGAGTLCVRVYDVG